ncbi:glycosyltransferase [Candidatus Nomurabacteria bacterium]|uniref:Glycosyltransferase n=1 Tax=candidate division WWE3 bacterium TaxID=2053526 RepID=A0A955E251_UNCKA|nr:glycosyltransferase [candidate division WWE3 bacterium]MCB9824154.1 glycosyltransferase [Candidatus Nomurabacteria bacterium]MCB9826875.1 glycosyltransferase [Candidatus Nomurabacteria bacterium]MCB9828095.1 glycosyltransferase [Candidatus Nomurabacteria bacterium]HXK52461.1 glycosyltransferase family 2 protein [bacterium]
MSRYREYPKISIITPSYNQGRFIKETIESVLSQNYPNLEYIVVDGASTDSTLDILRGYGERILWVSEKDNGQTEAINKGIAKSTGDIVAYLNSDDLLLPGSLFLVAQIFLDNPKIMWLSGDGWIINANGKKIQLEIKLFKNMLRLFPVMTVLAIANYIIQPSTFWRRTLHDDIGFFNEDLNYVMDFDFWMRAIKKYPLKVVYKNLSSFRIHDSSKCGTAFEKVFREQQEIVYKHTSNFFIRKLSDLHYMLARFFYKLLKRY